MNRLAALLAAVALAAVSAGCSPARSGSLGPAPTGSAPPGQTATASPDVTGIPSATPSQSPPAIPPPGATSKPAGTVTIQLWFTRAGKIVPTRRTKPATLSTSRLALTELATGPTVVEASTGLVTGFPAGTTFDIAGITGGVETVNFNAAFYAGGRDAARLRQAQVVYTLTQFSSVSKVGFQSGGQPVGWPVGRADYADLLPFIVVTSPVIGQQVASPITVAGTANVYEATVSIRILDSTGREIATAFTTATCGSGCRGDYRIAVSYRVTRQQNGIVEVYEVSAEDGSRLHAVAVPVTLVP